MTIRKTLAVLTATSLLTVGATGIAHAQATQEAPDAAAPELNTQGGADFDSEQVSNFAVAYLEVNEIGMQYDEQISSTESEEERAELQMQASEEMTATVESTEGISVEEYNAIFAAAQSDPEFAGEIESEINALMQE